MTRIRFTVASVFALVCLLPAAFAQDAAKRIAAKRINAGIVNGKAVSLPKPVYPEAARIAGISGAIGVNVLIDEAGAVIEAEADKFYQGERRDAEGNKLEPVEADITLREAAEDAARQARFSPTMLSGQPVKVKGEIVYNFVADKGTDTQVPRSTAGALISTEDARLNLSGGTLYDISGGALKSRAISLRHAAYPAAARAVRAEGTVAVEITIDEAGSVINAVAVSGHPLLRASAEKAAREAKFQPTLHDDKPVMVSGILTYNFVLPKKDDQ